MARLEPQFIPPEQLSEDDIAAIVAIGQKQAALLDSLAAAVEARDLLRTFNVAAEMVGLEKEIGR